MGAMGFRGGEGNDTGGDHDSSPPSKKFKGEEPCSSRLQELLDDLQQAPQDHGPYVKWVYTPQGVVPYVLDKEQTSFTVGLSRKMMVNSTTPVAGSPMPVRVWATVCNGKAEEV